MKTILILLFCAINVLARINTVLNNTVSFFSKDSLSQPIPHNPCAKIKIQIPVVITQPANTITQVYTQNFKCQDMNVKLNLYFHSQNGSQYFSQQVTLYLGRQLLSLCSGYFSTTQNFLVPGACAGTTGQKLYGFSIIK
ncbi:MAG: hypothetical protein JNL11_08605 [Bdellovibrionaceae bacterium]|nr:hypothetical protein [Pseudobdellovibrionaceae bacterium]